MKAKTLEDEQPASSSNNNNGKVSPAPGLRMHKSVRNFSDGRPESQGDVTPQNIEKNEISVERNAAQENNKTAKANMTRSSSATYFDREENAKAQANKAAAQTSVDKVPNTKVSSINGNIIHLTVNNYLAPVNNVNTAVQVADKDGKPKQISTPQGQIQRPPMSKLNQQDDKKSDSGFEQSKQSFSEVPLNDNKSLQSEKSSL